ncbi:MAG: hypothetical protein RIS70_3316, partial [Planctomycetota bacterium]
MRSPLLFQRLTWLGVCCGVMLYESAWSQEKPAAPEKPPRVAMATPLAVMPGNPVKVMLRGWDLEQATEVRSSNPRVQVKVLGKGKAAIPNKQDAKQVGDAQIELEVTVPADEATGETMLTVVGAKQESAAYGLLIGSPFPLLAETEPNDGFRQAQAVQFPQVVDGQIHGDQNVDMFVFELPSPRKVVIEVHARRRGSGLDSVLTLFSERGVILASADDVSEAPKTSGAVASSPRADSRIERMLPAGRYYLGLQDA